MSRETDIEYSGITPIDQIDSADFTGVYLYNTSIMLYIKRKSPAVRYISKFSIDYSSVSSSSKSLCGQRILNITGYQNISLEYINDNGKRSSIIKSYPLNINSLLPNKLLDYKLFLPYAVVYPIERRIVKADLSFLICFSERSEDTENNNIHDLKEDDAEIYKRISSVKEIINLDEEYM